MPIRHAGRPSAVLLDFDHTLFTFDDGVNWLWRAHQLLNRNADREWIQTLHHRIEATRSRPEVIREQHGCQRSTSSHRRATQSWFRRAGMDERLADALYACLLSPDGWTPYTDVARAFAGLRERDVPVAVVSNVGWDIRPIFARHDVERYVEVFVLSCELGVEKPDPAMFRVACARLGIPPHQAVMVGDDPINDGAAVAAGLRFRLLRSQPPCGCRGLAAALDLPQ